MLYIIQCSKHLAFVQEQSVPDGAGVLCLCRWVIVTGKKEWKRETLTKFLCIHTFLSIPAFLIWDPVKNTEMTPVILVGII